MGKSTKKAKISAQRNNVSRTKAAMDDDETLFGRATKTLGNGRFMIQTTDKDGHPIEASAVIAGRSVVRIQIGDVIVVGRNESSKHITYEILASCDKKAVKELRDKKRLHPCLFTEDDQLGDDIFDRSEEIAAEEEENKLKMEKGNKPSKTSKAAEATTRDMLAEEDEVNIDAI